MLKLMLLTSTLLLPLRLSPAAEPLPPSGGAPAGELHQTLKVPRLAQPLKIDADWDKPAWQKSAPTSISLFMGPRPAHQPATQFRVAYDDRNLYLIFRVQDRYVRAVATHDEGSVWEDSCVEFFFTPGPDPAAGYFNFETNCIGARLWHFHPGPKKDKSISPADLAFAEVAHSLSGPIEPEVATPLTWTVEYRVPFELIRRYTTVAQPAPGVRWRANFYKCGDKTSHPHFLTWSRVENKTPNFHLPQFFGTLEFTD